LNSEMPGGEECIASAAESEYSRPSPGRTQRSQATYINRV